MAAAFLVVAAVPVLGAVLVAVLVFAAEIIAHRGAGRDRWDD